MGRSHVAAPARRLWSTVFQTPGVPEAFFAVGACSWMPHWSCHFFRLGTRSTFVVGDWSFTRLDSVFSLLVYGGLSALNIAAVAGSRFRYFAAVLDGIGHLSVSAFHACRLLRPFRFEVMGHSWPMAASAVQVGILLGFSILCFTVASALLPRRDSGSG